jgi:exodeoxyribonuclease VII small subunit
MTDQQAAATAVEDVTFEEGYEELKSIVNRLGQDDVSVHEMFEGFRRGKGLEKSLRAYLEEREGELTEIEEGRNLPEFNIVAPSTAECGGDVAADTADFDPAASGDDVPADTADFGTAGSGDDDIPF